MTDVKLDVVQQGRLDRINAAKAKSHEGKSEATKAKVAETKETDASIPNNENDEGRRLRLRRKALSGEW